MVLLFGGGFCQWCCCLVEVKFLVVLLGLLVTLGRRSSYVVFCWWMILMLGVVVGVAGGHSLILSLPSYSVVWKLCSYLFSFLLPSLYYQLLPFQYTFYCLPEVDQESQEFLRALQNKRLREKMVGGDMVGCGVVLWGVVWCCRV